MFREDLNTDHMLDTFLKYEKEGKFYSYVYLLRQGKIAAYLVEKAAKNHQMTIEQVTEALKKYGIKVRVKETKGKNKVANP